MGAGLGVRLVGHLRTVGQFELMLALAYVLFLGIIGTLTAITYIMEPYWRMQAVTSLGVALSARTMHGVSATLNAGFSLIAFWIGWIAWRMCRGWRR